MIRVEFTAFCDLRADFANPFGHPSQVLQTCVDLSRRASPFGQGFRLTSSFDLPLHQTRRKAFLVHAWV